MYSLSDIIVRGEELMGTMCFREDSRDADALCSMWDTVSSMREIANSILLRLEVAPGEQYSCSSLHGSEVDEILEDILDIGHSLLERGKARKSRISGLRDIVQLTRRLEKLLEPWLPHRLVSGSLLMFSNFFKDQH